MVPASSSRIPSLLLPRVLAVAVPAYTASDSDENVKSRTLIGGMYTAPPAPRFSDALMRIVGPIASRLFKKKIGDSLKRKFLIGRVTLPFSIRNVPSRVRPV